MASITETQEVTTSDGNPIKLAVAYDDKIHNTSKYAVYLPVYDTTTKFPPTELFEFSDRGHNADPAKSNLLRKDDSSLKVTKLTPRVGTEITGLQLSQLSDAQKDELALLVAERGVVVFRDQDFKDIGAERQKEFGKYFGRLHVHVISPICQLL
jgi:sulfonate dioxygenase